MTEENQKPKPREYTPLETFILQTKVAEAVNLAKNAANGFIDEYHKIQAGVSHFPRADREKMLRTWEGWKRDFEAYTKAVEAMEKKAAEQPKE